MKKTFTVLALLCAVILQAAAAVKPEFADSKTIVCGNRKISFAQDGTLSISNPDKEIVSIKLQHVFLNSDTKKPDWITTTPALCKVRQEGNKVVWELWKKHELHTWKIADQTLEILADGTLELSAQVYNPDTQKLTPRQPFASYFILMPVQGNEGKKIVFNGKEITLNANTKPCTAWRGKYVFNLFPDNPEENIIFRNKNVYQAGMLITSGKHRISYHFQKDGKCSVIIDLAGQK